MKLLNILLLLSATSLLSVNAQQVNANSEIAKLNDMNIVTEITDSKVVAVESKAKLADRQKQINSNLKKYSIATEKGEARENK